MMIVMKNSCQEKIIKYEISLKWDPIFFKKKTMQNIIILWIKLRYMNRELEERDRNKKLVSDTWYFFRNESYLVRCSIFQF